MGLLDDMASDITGANVFYDKDSGFGEDAIINGSTTITVLFDREFSPYEPGSIEMQSSRPQAWCRDADAPSIGDQLQIGTEFFTVRQLQPNREGETLIVMHVSEIMPG